MAEYRLALLNHWSGCESCQNDQACQDIRKIPLPNHLQVAASESSGDELAKDLCSLFLEEFRSSQQLDDEYADIDGLSVSDDLSSSELPELGLEVDTVKLTLSRKSSEFLDQLPVLPSNADRL